MKYLSPIAFIFAFFSAHLLLAQVCPGSDEVEAKVSHVYGGKFKVIVCGFEEIGSKAPKGKLQLNDFTVYSLGVDEKPTKIFSVGAVENHWVGKEEKKGIVFDELMWITGQLKPFLRSEITCNDAGCSRSELVCVLKRPKSKVPDIARQIDKRLRSKITRIQLPLSGMVELAFSEALAGNSASIAFFNNNEWLNKLDDNASQTFLISKKALDRVNEMGCWKKSITKKR